MQVSYVHEPYGETRRQHTADDPSLFKIARAPVDHDAKDRGLDGFKSGIPLDCGPEVIPRRFRPQRRVMCRVYDGRWQVG